MKPQFLVFDWDNTLVNTWPVIHRALEETYLAYDLEPMSMEQVMQNVKFSLRDSFPHIFGENWENARDLFYQTFEEIHLTKLKKIDQADNFLDAAQQLDIPMALVSNKTGKYLRKEVEFLGWSKYFINIIGAGDAKKDKPAVEPLALALNKTSKKFGHDVWFIGDSEVDIEISKNAGCIGVLMHFDTKPDHINLVPDQIHANFSSLLNEIKKYH